MTTNKLILFGWVDASGRSLSWKDWQQKPRRVSVGYWVGDDSPLTPFYEANPQVKVRRDKQH